MQEKNTNYTRKVDAFLSDTKSIKENFPESKLSTKKRIMETTLYHSPDIVDKIADYKKFDRNRDEVMKDFLTNGRFTGYILTGLLEELKGMSIDEFCISAGVDPDTGGDLRREATEFGSSVSKTIRLDLMFEINDKGEIELRVNTEPQTKRYNYTETYSKSYSLIGRGIYYAAMALAMEIQSEEEFHLLRKVYSIWICYERPIANVYEPILRYKMNPEFEYTYHNNNSSIHTNKHKFDDGNLLSVIFISVPDLERAVNAYKKPHYKENYDYEFLKGLYTILSNDVGIKEREQFYYDSKIIKKKGLVKDMRPFVLELDMAYANDIMKQQKMAIQEMDTTIQEMDTTIQEMDTTIQRKNLKLASNLFKSGKLDGLTQEKAISLIMEEVEVDYNGALELYKQLF